MGRSKFKSSPNGSRSEGSRVFASTSEAEWACATRGKKGHKKGVHIWNVRLVAGAEGVSVGITFNKNVSRVNSDANIPYRYDLYCGQGRVVDTDNNDYAHFKGPFENGTLVSMCLDLDAHTLTYGVNGQWKSKPAFRHLGSKQKWYPYVALQRKGCKVAFE